MRNKPIGNDAAVRPLIDLSYVKIEGAAAWRAIMYTRSRRCNTAISELGCSMYCCARRLVHQFAHTETAFTLCCSTRAWNAVASRVSFSNKALVTASYNILFSFKD